jgi:hypothetical protein
VNVHVAYLTALPEQNTNEIIFLAVTAPVHLNHR